MTRFIGRRKQINDLKLLISKKVASFAVIRGRRRIGKSRLIEEFSKEFPSSHIFSGLPPNEETTRQSQIDTFCAWMGVQFGLPKFKLDSWGEVFEQLGKLCRKGRVLVALDEVSWIGSKDPDFLGHLKNGWDISFSKNPKLVLIVCGSVSSWIEKNILSSTGFVGRISKDMHLKELPLDAAAEFWDGKRASVSPTEILKVLSVTGGVPRYLEEIQPKFTAEENIRQICFDPLGLLYREFDQIFSTLFTSQAASYAALVSFLSGNAKSLEECAAALDKAPSTVSPYLNDLVQAGFVSEDPTWNLNTMKVSQLKRYRLSDNYVRFYLRYILPHKPAIERGIFEMGSLATLPDWDSVMGLQFENLVLRNVLSLLPLLHLPPGDVALFGPFFQRKTQRQDGCQIDLLIQTRHKTVFICEMKFSSGKIGMDVVNAVQEKQKRISLPKGWSSRLVLIHANGISHLVSQADVFDYVIDFSQLI